MSVFSTCSRPLSTSRRSSVRSLDAVLSLEHSPLPSCSLFLAVFVVQFHSLLPFYCFLILAVSRSLSVLLLLNSCSFCNLVSRSSSVLLLLNFRSLSFSSSLVLLLLVPGRCFNSALRCSTVLFRLLFLCRSHSLSLFFCFFALPSSCNLDCNLINQNV